MQFSFLPKLFKLFCVNNPLFLCIIVFSCSISLSNKLSAQNSSSLFFSSLEKKDGLPSNAVNCTIKDDNGFIWIGTADGLCRYDAENKFTVYNSSNQSALKVNYIRCLDIDKHHNIWIGTTLGGVTKYNTKTGLWKNYSHSIDSTAISNDEILHILVDSENRVWVGTENGLNVYDEKADKFISHKMQKGNTQALQANTILDIFEDDKGWIWLGTWDGGFYLLCEFENLNQLKFRQFLPSLDRGSRHIWKITQDKNLDYWIGSHSSGLFYMTLPENSSNRLGDQNWQPDIDQFEFTFGNPNSLPNNTIFDILSDNNGDLWICTAFGLSRLSAEYLDTYKSTREMDNVVFERYSFDPTNATSIVNNDIEHIYEDDQGLIWLSTLGGISIYNKLSNQFDNLTINPNYTVTPNSQNIQIIDETLWLAMGDGGIMSYNVESGQLNEFNTQIENIVGSSSIFSLTSIDNETLYVSSQNGIFEINTKTWTYNFYKIPEVLLSKFKRFIAKCLHVDRKGRIWIGTELGLLLYDKKLESYRFLTANKNGKKYLTDSSISCIEGDAYGNLWIGTFNGLNQLISDTPDLKFKHYKREGDDDNSIISNRVLALEFVDKKLYIGTDQGFAYYDYETKSFKKNSIKNNKSYILSLQKHGDNQIWGTTSDGIFNYNLESKVIRDFDRSDGIEDLTFSLSSHTTDRNGFIYFGNSHGAVRLNPEDYLTNETLPTVHFTEANIINPDGEKSISLLDTDKLDLKYNDYYLSLSYVGLNYNSPEKNQSAYMLEGFDEDWIYTNESNPVVYTNLKSGLYKFKVKAANDVGIWTENPRVLEINIAPAFWQTLWFKALMVCLFLLSLYYGIRTYTKSVRDKNLELQGLNLQLSNEVSQRKKIAFDLKKSEQRLKLTNSELVQSNIQLEQFAYIASHDLKEPLRTIGTFTELTKRKLGNESEQVHGYMDMVKGAVLRMHDLIESILKFSSLETGQIEYQEIELDKIVAENLEDLNQRIADNNTEITVSPLPIINGNPSQISMLFQNLISNAIKFNTSESPFVKVYELKNHTSGYTTVVVEDNGIGISKDYQHKIFELFQRLHSNEKFEGTGIGLALCKKIIETHNGVLKIDSVINKGTKFIISLPIIENSIEQKKTKILTTDNIVQ